MPIQWTAAAEKDLDAIEAYITQDNPAAAIRQVLRVIDAVEQNLPDMPYLGRAGRVPGTRELVVPGTPYIVAYQVRRKSLEVLRVLPHAQRWPDAF